MRLTKLLFALSLAPAIAGAQRPILLTKPDAEFSEPYSQLVAVRELKDGRVIVVDNRDKVVQLLDFKTGATRIGREGAGPGEYALPNAVAVLPGDSTAVWDGMNRRYLLLGPTGGIVKEFRLEPPEGLSTRGYGAFASTFPRGTDAKGNIYFQGSPFIVDDSGQRPADSIPVLRFNRASQRPETLAFIHPAEGNAKVTAAPGGRGVSITNGLSNPLLPLDEWAALPNGAVAVLRGDNYRMDVYTARNAMTRGPLVQYAKPRVDDAVKAVVTAERKRQLAGAAPRSRPGGGNNDAPNVPTDILKQMMNLEPWPEFVPPFQRGAVTARPMGATAQVWVLRTRRSDKDSSRYDIFDASGKVTATATFAPKTTVIAFGSGTVYAVRADDDELQYLQRYRLP